MRGIRWRRVVNVSVAAAIAAIGLSVQPTPASSSSSGTLFGVVGCLGCPESLDRLDPATGAETQVVDLRQVGAIQALVADPTSNLLYGAGGIGGGKGGPPGVSELMRIDSQNGTITVVPGPPVLDLAIDPTGHTLFGLATKFNGQSLSASILRIDASTFASTEVANLPFGERELVFDSVSNTLYTHSGDFSTFPPSGKLYEINAGTGAVSTVDLHPAVAELAFDSVTRSLYGVAAPLFNFVRLNPATGAETAIGSFSFSGGSPTAVTIDSRAHTVYLVETDIVVGGERQTRIATLSDLTGGGTVGPVTAQAVIVIAFQPAPITPESIKQDVRNALASGAIDNAGVASSMLAKLDAASAARSRGECGTAANIYQAFINEVESQSGKHVAAATASQLIGEAQFLIANCR